MPFPNPKHFRKKVNWYAAVAVEGLSPLLRLHARMKTGAASDPRHWRKAIILGANHLGDLLYRSASLEHLKAGLPECEFHYLTAPGSTQILEGNPALTGILPWVRSDSPLDLAPEHFAALDAMGFDAALCTNTSMVWRDLLLAIRLGIPNRVACADKGFSGWVTHPIPIRRPQPFAAYIREYVAIVTQQKADWPARPVIYPTPQDEADATALWAHLQMDRHPNVTACFMTTRQPTPIWPSARFGQALKALRSKTETHILLCGAAEDEATLSGVNREYGLGADVVAGKLGIRALCCFLRRCTLVLATDSGPRHIANAAGVPVLFVRNVWSNAVETGAYLDTETDLCAPPHDGNRGDGAALLAAIDPERVAEMAAAILSRSLDQSAI